MAANKSDTQCRLGIDFEHRFSFRLPPQTHTHTHVYAYYIIILLAIRAYGDVRIRTKL